MRLSAAPELIRLPSSSSASASSVICPSLSEHFRAGAAERDARGVGESQMRARKGFGLITCIALIITVAAGAHQQDETALAERIACIAKTQPALSERHGGWRLPRLAAVSRCFSAI